MQNIFENIYDGKTVLVTGSTGFKGSWLCTWLVSVGANVIGYALRPLNEKDNYVISGLAKKITYIDNDIRDYQKLHNVFSKYKPDIVFHLAAQAIVLESYNDPIYTYSTNVMGTVNLFEAIRQTSSVKVAINVTSDKCYENQEWIYGYREIDPMGGKDPYSASKSASEIITSSYQVSFFSKEDTTNIASVRAGNVIGGGDWSPNRILPDCIRALNNNEPIIIRNPNSVRPWQHVLDPLCGYLTLGAKLYMEGKKYSGAWNFGPSTKNFVTVKQLVNETIKQWGSGEYILKKEVDTNPEESFLHLDISKAVNLLNWVPVLDFKNSIKFSIEEYKVNDLISEEVFTQRINHIKKYMNLRFQSGSK